MIKSAVRGPVHGPEPYFWRGLCFAHRLVLMVVVLGLCGVVFVPSVSFAAGDANSGSCPAASEASPGFREYLPDCRAYELVTPAFTFGEPVFVDGVSEGGGLAYHSIGSFGEPGDDSEELGGSYVGARGGSGWGAVAVNPSASEFQGGDPILQAGNKAETIYFSADLSESLFLQAPVSLKQVDSRFYRRSVSDGSYR